jgi:hypothetical protein
MAKKLPKPGLEAHVNIDGRLNTRIFATTRRHPDEHGRMYFRNKRTINISPANQGPVTVVNTRQRIRLARADDYDPRNPYHAYAFKTGMALLDMILDHCDGVGEENTKTALQDLRSIPQE